MRKADLTADQIFEAEKAADDRRNNRAGGFQLMRERDGGHHTLSNGVTMIWHVPKPHIDTVPDGYVFSPGCNMHPDYFALEVDGQRHLFNTEEFKQWMRWT